MISLSPVAETAANSIVPVNPLMLAPFMVSEPGATPVMFTLIVPAPVNAFASVLELPVGLNSSNAPEATEIAPSSWLVLEKPSVPAVTVVPPV